MGEFKLGTGDELKRIGTARRPAASSCHAFAIATFSSFVKLLVCRPIEMLYIHDQQHVVYVV